MGKHLRYRMGATGHDSQHPQLVMKDLGITYQYSTPQSLYDEWWFWNCENLPAELPPFLTNLKINPTDAIGYGLSKDVANRILSYSEPTANKTAK